MPKKVKNNAEGWVIGCGGRGIEECDPLAPLCTCTSKWGIWSQDVTRTLDINGDAMPARVVTLAAVVID